MRGKQLADIAARTTLRDRGIFFESADAGVRGSDLFLTKGAARTASAEALRQWRRNGNRILFDPVDEAVNDDLIHPDDTLVAASRSALGAYRERWPHLRVRLVNHHVDPRVAEAVRAAPRRAAPRIAYFGEPENTYLPPAVTQVVDVHPVDTSRPEQAWFGHLPQYAIHYAVRRPRALDHHKPFLKGFTAAACRANIIIQRDQAEAALWLPTDYPFWVDAPISDSSIERTVHDALASFGSREWEYGLAVMRELRNATDAEATGRALEALFAE